MTDLINLDAERAVVGAVFSRPDAMAELADRLPPEAFGDRQCRWVYKAMLNLWNKSPRVPADYITVPAEIVTAMGGKSEAAVLEFVTGIATEYYPGYGLDAHTELILEMARRRTLAEQAAGLVKAAHDGEPDLDAALTTIRQRVEAFRPRSTDGESIAEQAAMVRDEALARWSGDLVDVLIPTGIASLDRMLNGGMRLHEFMVLAGRPGMGKSSVALHMARQCRALYVSLEMPWKLILNRLIAAVSGVPYRVGVTGIGSLDEQERWLWGSEQVERLPLTVTDKVRTTAEIQAEVVKHGYDLVIIDHLGRLADHFKGNVSSYERMSTLSWRCKEMTLRNDLAIIGLSQLNREVESRSGCTPFLSDLRESGRLEEDADHIALLYNRWYYASRGMGGLDAKADLDFIAGTNWERMVVQLAKNRNGETGGVEVGWEAKPMRLHDPDERWSNAA